MHLCVVVVAYRGAPADVLHKAVEDALACTHVHPVGVDGAYIQVRGGECGAGGCKVRY